VSTRSRGWGREALIFAAAYLVYQLFRTLATGAEPLAIENAHRVLGAEAALGIDVEAAAQGAFDGTIWLTALSWVYLLAQPVVIPLVVVWVYRRSRPVYRILRNTLIAGWMVALPVYALFPTAPPRLAEMGLSDSVSAESGVELQSDFTTLFYNPFAAVPSLHCGFAFACGLAVAAASQRRSIRLAGWIWGPLVSVSTVVTANHFVIDLGAGLAVTAAGLAIGLAIARMPAGPVVSPMRPSRPAGRLVVSRIPTGGR
jgi:membrane-associated phospholipid phosphatase